jgi:hypothetical protein
MHFRRSIDNKFINLEFILLWEVTLLFFKSISNIFFTHRHGHLNVHKICIEIYFLFILPLVSNK